MTAHTHKQPHALRVRYIDYCEKVAVTYCESCTGVLAQLSGLPTFYNKKVASKLGRLVLWRACAAVALNHAGVGGMESPE